MPGIVTADWMKTENMGHHTKWERRGCGGVLTRDALWTVAIARLVHYLLVYAAMCVLTSVNGDVFFLSFCYSYYVFSPTQDFVSFELAQKIDSKDGYFSFTPLQLLGQLSGEFLECFQCLLFDSSCTQRNTRNLCECYFLGQELS